MIDENIVMRLCNKYHIKPKIFHETDTILLDSGLDEWKMELINGKIKLMHKNKLKQRDKFHLQRWFNNIYQCIDSISGHKGILKSLYAQPTYCKNNSLNRN